MKVFILIICLCSLQISLKAQQDSTIDKTSWLKGLETLQQEDIDFNFRLQATIKHNKKLFDQQFGHLQLSNADIMLINFYDNYTDYAAPFEISGQPQYRQFNQFNFSNPLLNDTYIISPLQIDRIKH